jgi:hypothetical protein
MVVGAVSVVLAQGVVALGANAKFGAASICPRVYAPVSCSNGRTYTNSCVAASNHATDCVSIPGYEPQIPRAGKRSVLDEQPEVRN